MSKLKPTKQYKHAALIAERESAEKRNYIQNYINNCIGDNAGIPDTASIDEHIETLKAAQDKIEAICEYAVRFGDISETESAAYRKPFYETFSEQLFQ